MMEMHNPSPNSPAAEMAISAESNFVVKQSARDSLGAVAVRGGSWVVGSQAISTGIRVACSILLARLLMPSDFGLYAMLAAVASGLLIFKDLGLCDAIIQAPNLTDRQISSLFWVNLGIGCGIAGLLVAVSPLLGKFYGQPKMPGIAAVWSLIIVFGALSAQHQALLKREMLFAGVSRVTMIAATFSNFGAVLLAWLGLGYWALVLRDVMNEAVITAGAWYLCSWRPGRFSRGSGIRPLLFFGANSIGTFVVRRTTRNMDRTLLGWRFGPTVTGYYHMAFELAAMLTSLIIEPLRNVAVSSLSKLRGEPERFRQHYLKALSGVAFLCFAASAVLIATSNDLVVVFLGAKWERSGPILCVLGLSSGVYAIYLTSVWLHFSLGRADRMARWTILETVVIAAGVVAGLHFGAIGVAWGYSLSICLLCLAGIWYAGRPVDLTFGDTVKAMWRQAIAAAVGGAVSWYITRANGIVASHLGQLILFCALFGTAYVGLIIVLGGGFNKVRMAIALHRRMGTISTLSFVLGEILG